MSTPALIFTVIGVTYTVAQFMRFIEWLDTPRRNEKPLPGAATSGKGRQRTAGTHRIRLPE